jgi:hypothetical protein
MTLLLLGLVGLAGCVLQLFDDGQPEPPGLAFSHRVHVVDEGFDCSDCHTAIESSDDPGMPAQGQCMLCHDEIDAEKPPERQIATLFADGAFKAGRFEALQDGELIFSHRAHATGSQDCDACHTGIEENEWVGSLKPLAMAECQGCHATAGAPNECATCHSEIRADRPPASHAFHWDKTHGDAVRAGGLKGAQSCSLCHDESTCTSCHMSEPPENHNNHWRRRGHSLMAQLDRDRCSTCHQPDACDRCHMQTQPMSHAGMWGGTRSRHCVSCHFPLQSEGCSVCHKATPSHSLAAPKPPGHTPLLDCRQCHGIVAPLPHVDKGDDCNICHM